MKDIEVLIEAIDFYGVETQKNMLLEEMAELQDAICKERRGRVGLWQVREEIADVEIMIRQMKLIYGEAEVNEMIDRKIARLHQRVIDKLSGISNDND